MHTQHHYTEPGQARRAAALRRLSNGPAGSAPLPVVTHQGGAEIRLGRPDDGPGPAQTERYLPQAAPSRTLSTAIRIRLIGATTQTDRGEAAARTVHAAPPEDGKPELDSALPGLGFQSSVSGSPTSSPATHSTTPFLSNVRHGDTGREAWRLRARVGSAAMGDSAITVNTAPLIGTAAFSGLEQWTAHTAPARQEPARRGAMADFRYPTAMTPLRAKPGLCRPSGRRAAMLAG